MAFLMLFQQSSLRILFITDAAEFAFEFFLGELAMNIVFRIHVFDQRFLLDETSRTHIAVELIHSVDTVRFGMVFGSFAVLQRVG